MAHRIKCKECNSCMAPIWILPNRYYYCDFCRVYYTGMDEALTIFPREDMYKLMQENQYEREETQRTI